jgi:hypothetical protein
VDAVLLAARLIGVLAVAGVLLALTFLPKLGRTRALLRMGGALVVGVLSVCGPGASTWQLAAAAVGALTVLVGVYALRKHDRYECAAGDCDWCHAPREGVVRM